MELALEVIILTGVALMPLPFLRPVYPEESGAVCGTMFVDGLVTMRASRRMESSRLLALVNAGRLTIHRTRGYFLPAIDLSPGAD